jgi:hypothetical protein
VKPVSVLLLAALALAAQSNPSWWNYIPPEATAIVGMHWPDLEASVFGAAVAEELLPGGSLQFPDLPILRTAEQILLGAPELLAVEYGKFPLARLREQAAAAGFQKSAWKGAELWLAPDVDQLSVAWIHERLLLVGQPRILKESIARVSDPKNRLYSPLLARAARYADQDLWIVARRLPDALASRFVPLEAEASAFEGALSMWNGLHLVAAIERPTPSQALELADDLAELLASRPVVAEGAEITTKDRSVLIRIDLNERQLAAALRRANPAPELAAAPASQPQPKPFAPPPTPARAAASVPSEGLLAETHLPEATVAQAGFTAPIAPAAMPAKPKVIRILGLEAGPREIILKK